MAGGIDHGRGGGIVHGIMMQVGNTIEALLRFIAMCPMAGGTTIEKGIGAAINGMFSQYRMFKSRIIGEAGNRIDIGKGITPGALRILSDRGWYAIRLKEGEEIIQTTGIMVMAIIIMGDSVNPLIAHMG